MKKIMFILTLISFILVVFFIIIFINTNNKIIYALAITFGTILYHLSMRLIVGYVINFILKNKINYKKYKWFFINKFEIKFYYFLKIKQWKKHIPTFEPSFYNFNKNQLEKIIMVTCQAEIVHEIIMIFSLVPILFYFWFDEIVVFIITSIIALLIDYIFVILQRFNRYRLIKITNIKRR